MLNPFLNKTQNVEAFPLGSYNTRFYCGSQFRLYFGHERLFPAGYRMKLRLSRSANNAANTTSLNILQNSTRDTKQCALRTDFVCCVYKAPARTAYVRCSVRTSDDRQQRCNGTRLRLHISPVNLLISGFCWADSLHEILWYSNNRNGRDKLWYFPYSRKIHFRIPYMLQKRD